MGERDHFSISTLELVVLDGLKGSAYFLDHLDLLIKLSDLLLNLATLELDVVEHLIHLCDCAFELLLE
jgi:hypothetical protein